MSRPSYWRVDADGRSTLLPVDRWHGSVEPAARTVIGRCAGPTVDVGCGPGRITAALAHRGFVSLGIDISTAAVRLTRRRGGLALHRDVFDPLPGEGSWWHALLLDGNIGIGGNPAALLRRCADLVRPGGTVVVELDPPGAGLWLGLARVAHGRSYPGRSYRGRPFRWARLGIEATPHVATAAGLRLRALFCRDHRWFAELERPR